MADESRISGARRGGFTLIELMIVVAIVGILSATAIPNFRRFQLRSKSSEAKMNLGAIRTAEEAVLAEFGSYISAPASPASYGGRKATTFVDVGPVGGNFDTLGWRPEGEVFFQYSVTVESTAFTAEAAAAARARGNPRRRQPRSRRSSVPAASRTVRASSDPLRSSVFPRDSRRSPGRSAGRAKRLPACATASSPSSGHAIDPAFCSLR
ncbi:MAG: prepilin-type N-terminal cleavage/methylation domain-containing protein [Deltaproteobacteria bacterium]|nr:prepilin-type N-terminal cleavage/methylation domain-containing protein [Deltaproteobacteria bacterium]